MFVLTLLFSIILNLNHTEIWSPEFFVNREKMLAALATVSVTISSPVLGWILQHAYSHCIWPMGFFIFLKPENSERFQKRVVSKNCNHTLSLDLYFFLLTWIHKKTVHWAKKEKKHTGSWWLTTTEITTINEQL